MSEDKKEKKRSSKEKNYQEGLQQENYLDDQIRSIIRNTRQDQKEIGEDGKEKEQESKE